MIKKALIFLTFILFLAMASPEKISYTLTSIPNNSEFNPLYQLRIKYNTVVSVDSDLSADKFTTAFENTDISCHSVESDEYINQFADYTSNIIGTYTIFANSNYYCESNKDEYYRDDLIVLITKHPLGGYPLFPMYNYSYDFIYHGAIDFPIIKVFYGSRENTNYYRYIARFKVNNEYVFIKSRAQIDEDSKLPEIVKTQVDYIYNALTN